MDFGGSVFQNTPDSVDLAQRNPPRIGGAGSAAKQAAKRKESLIDKDVTNADRR